MRLIHVAAPTRLRPYLTIGLAVTGFVLVWYFLTLLVGNAYLSAISDGSLPANTNTWYEQHRIILDDHLLSTVTPKLRQVLINAPDITVTEPAQQERNEVLVSALEMDQINRMLASTERGKQLIAEGWDNDYNRGQLIYPYPGSVGFVGYNGIAYHMEVSNAPLAFPFDPTGEGGWFLVLWRAFFFGIAVFSAIVLAQTIQGLKRKEFVGGRVDAAYLGCVVGVVTFVVALWYFIIYRLL